MEQILSGDVFLGGEAVGGADYVLVAPGTQMPPPLLNVLSTCEVKGPTRAAFLDPTRFGHNWARRALVDLDKQTSRALAAPAAEHHMAFLIPFEEIHVLDRINLAFVLPALRMLPSARMKRSGFASVSLADGHDLTVIVYCITCEPPTVL